MPARRQTQAALNASSSSRSIAAAEQSVAAPPPPPAAAVAMYRVVSHAHSHVSRATEEALNRHFEELSSR